MASISRKVLRRRPCRSLLSDCGQFYRQTSPTYNTLRFFPCRTKATLVYPTLESVFCSTHHRAFSTSSQGLVLDPFSLSHVPLPVEPFVEDDLLFENEDDISPLDQDLSHTTLEAHKQSLENAQLLFDSMAPHLTYGEIMNINTKLQKFTNMSQSESKSSARKLFIDPYVSVMGRINAILNGDSVVSPSSGPVKKKKLVDPWVTSHLAQFFTHTSDEYQQQLNPHAEFISKDPTFPPNINRMHFDRNVNLWMKARELSLDSNVFTLKHYNISKRNSVQLTVAPTSNRPSDDITADAQLLAHIHTKKSLHNSSKSLDNRKAEAEHFASRLADQLPNKIHDRIIKLLINILDSKSTKNTTDPTTISIPPKPVKKRKEGHHPADDSSLLKETKNQTPKNKKNKPLLFFPNLKTIADLHIHSILEDIVTFFDHPISESQDSSTILINPKSSLQDPQVQKSRKRWSKLREDLAQVLLAAQHSYVHCCEDSDHPDAGLGVEDEFFNHPLHEDGEGSIQSLGKIKEKNSTSVASSARERSESRKFIIFNTLLFQDYLIPSSQSNHSHDIALSNAQSPPTATPTTFPSSPDNIVFIDNLPIDITEEELNTLYSRCGNLESIHIFNRKPWLDPGEKSVLKQKLLIKSNRLSGLKATNRRFRQRSPVYAMLKFKDIDGYKTATMDALRIFGMVVRRHPVRSIPAHTMTKLYIENLSAGQRSVVIEEKLCELFFPFMRVYIDLGMDPMKDARNLEVRFPSFESCYFCFSLLAKKRDDHTFGLDKMQWLKTPPNSMDYWTRKIVGEP